MIEEEVGWALSAVDEWFSVRMMLVAETLTRAGSDAVGTPELWLALVLAEYLDVPPVHGLRRRVQRLDRGTEVLVT